MSSANAFNLDWSNILSFGIELKGFDLVNTVKWCVYHAGLFQKKGCADAQHASKLDQNIVTHEEHVVMLKNCKWGYFIKGT